MAHVFDLPEDLNMAGRETIRRISQASKDYAIRRIDATVLFQRVRLALEDDDFIPDDQARPIAAATCGVLEAYARIN